METETKTGYKTTEFWLSLLAVLLGFFIASGVLEAVPADSVINKFIGAGVTMLTALGYTVARTKAKSLPK
jgi:hypothetical protein